MIKWSPIEVLKTFSGTVKILNKSSLHDKQSNENVK